MGIYIDKCAHPHEHRQPTHTHTQVHRHAGTHTQAHMHTFTHIHLQAHTQTYTHTCRHTHTRRHTHSQASSSITTQLSSGLISQFQKVEGTIFSLLTLSPEDFNKSVACKSENVSAIIMQKQYTNFIPCSEHFSEEHVFLKRKMVSS